MRLLAGRWLAAAALLVSWGAVNALPDPAATGAASSCTQTPVVVPNGGFEGGALKPWAGTVHPVPGGGTASSLRIVPGGYNHSGHALQMTVGLSARIEQAIHSCQAATYTASFAYKVVNASATCHIVASAVGYTDNLNPLIDGGGWTHSAFNYTNTDGGPVTLAFALRCPYEDTGATILLDDIGVVTTGSVADPGCPRAVSITNGGFDSGQLAPWTDDSSPVEDPPSVQVVAPGFAGTSHALALSFPRTNYSSALIRNNFTHLCDTFQYNISFALNWGNYSGPNGDSNNGCGIAVGALNCDNALVGEPIFYAVRQSGWHDHTYLCRADGNGASIVDIMATCEVELNHTPIPAFAMQVDSISIKLVPPTS